jgi:hypothetical protein
MVSTVEVIPEIFVNGNGLAEGLAFIGIFIILTIPFF